MQFCFLYGTFSLTVIEDRHTDRQSDRIVPSVFHLLSESEVAAAGVVGSDAFAKADCGQITLYKTIEGLWLDANSAQQRYAAANEKLKSTQISYELISEQFNLGMKNTIELLTEKNNLLQAQQEQLQAKYMAILKTQLLKFYQGDQLAI